MAKVGRVVAGRGSATVDHVTLSTYVACLLHRLLDVVTVRASAGSDASEDSRPKSVAFPALDGEWRNKLEVSNKGKQRIVPKAEDMKSATDRLKFVWKYSTGTETGRVPSECCVCTYVRMYVMYYTVSQSDV